MGKLVTTGLVIQIITSLCFEALQQHLKPLLTVRDFICLLGQSTGELLYCIAFWVLFSQAKLIFFKAVMEFYMSIVIVNLFVIIFLNPYEPSLPKYAGFVFALIILLLRTKSYIGDTTRHT